MKAHTVYVENEHGVRDFTRDIFHVKARIDNRLVHILVNHWPSRRKGVEETSYRRLAAAEKAGEVVAFIKAEDPLSRIIIMGDFNDDPQSASLQHLVSSGFYNPMELLLTKEIGSTNYRGKWFLFDQILVSHNFMQLHGNDI